jgi:isopenicillin-N N-acyltransferase-like protein
MNNEGQYARITISSSDPFERGYQYGEQLRDKIRERINLRFEKGRRQGLDKDQILIDAMKVWPFIEEYASYIGQEIRGIAEGSGSTLEEAAMLNSFGPIALYAATRQTVGCTSFAVAGEATADGKTYVGQNDDMWARDDEFATLLTIETATNKILGLAYAGEFPRKGVNSNGIALCVNALYDGRARPGVPGTVVTRDVLQQETIGGALYSIMRADRGAAANYVIGDQYGELYDIETTMDGYELIYGQDTLVHANHFLAKDLASRDLGIEDGPCSVVRYNRIKKLIDRGFGSIDAEMLKGILADHVNYPGSICRHDSGHAPDSPPDKRFSTVASLIFIPEDGVLLVAEGNPCETRYLELTL